MEKPLPYLPPKSMDRDKDSLKILWDFDLRDNMAVALHTAYGLTPFLACKITANMTEDELKEVQAMQELAKHAAQGLNIIYEQLSRIRRLNWFNDVSSFFIFPWFFSQFDLAIFANFLSVREVCYPSYLDEVLIPLYLDEDSLFSRLTHSIQE